MGELSPIQHIYNGQLITVSASKSKMGKSETENHQPPPPGYPIATDNPTTGKSKKCLPQTKKKGDRGFIEGCLFALCCCWLCEVCF